MANEDHLAQLNKGKDSWEQWRNANSEILPDLSGADLRNRNFKAWNLRSVNFFRSDLGKCDLSEADLAEANLAEAVAFDSNLTKANLHRATVTKTNLIDAVMEEGQLMLADFSSANLTRAKLHQADLWSAKLSSTILSEANLSLSNMKNCDLRAAILQEANLTGANLTDSDLRDSDFRGACLNDANVRGVTYNRRMKFRGVRTDGCYGNRTFRRFAEDQDYLEELRSTLLGHLTYWFWWAVADCGRSFFRWMLSTGIICAAFALAFWYFDGHCHVASSSGCLAFNSIPGYGEISVRSLLGIDVGPMLSVPPIMRHLSMAESIVGYILLGGLVSIFANKLARRA